VLAYSSRVLSKAETNYDVTRRELLAVVFGLKTYKQYLLGRHFVIRTDHSALQSLRRTPEPIGQQARSKVSWSNSTSSLCTGQGHSIEMLMHYQDGHRSTIMMKGDIRNM